MKPVKRRRRRPSERLVNGSVEKPIEVQTLFKHFPTLRADQLERMAEEISLVRFKRGDRILVERPSAADIFLVLKGAIAITWQHDSRHQVLVALLAPGEIFGDSSSMPEMAHG